MLEQYRKEYPAEEKDLLPDNESSMGKRKFLLILAGATCALLFFLFLMGLFRSDEENLVHQDQKVQIDKEYASAVDQKIATLTARLEKLEAELAKAETLAITARENHAIENKEMIAEKQDTTLSSDSPSITLSQPEDAVAMTTQALRRFIEKNDQSPKPVIHTAAAATKQAPIKKEQKVVAKTKVKKGKDKIITQVPNSYVIQRGDTLSKISVRCYGTPNKWKAIYDANRDRINNINQLKVGTTLLIPQDKK